MDATAWSRRKWIGGFTIPAWIKRRVTFYRLHFLCFVIVDLIGTLVIYLTPGGPLGPISFIDALFNATSALCVTGLITVKINVFSILDQVTLLLLMLLGSQVFTSLLPVLVRRYYFHQYLMEEDPSIFDSSYAGTPANLSHATSCAASHHASHEVLTMATAVTTPRGQPRIMDTVHSPENLPPLPAAATARATAGSPSGQQQQSEASGSRSGSSRVTSTAVMPTVGVHYPPDSHSGVVSPIRDSATRQSASGSTEAAAAAVPGKPHSKSMDNIHATTQVGGVHSAALSSSSASTPQNRTSRKISPVADVDGLIAVNSQGGGADADGHEGGYAMTWSGDRAQVERERFKRTLEQMRMQQELRERERERERERMRGIEGEAGDGSPGWGLGGFNPVQLLWAGVKAAAAGSARREETTEDEGEGEGEVEVLVAEEELGEGVERRVMTEVSSNVGVVVDVSDPDKEHSRLVGELLGKVVPAEQRLIELKALELLSWLVPTYMFGLLVFCFVFFIAITWPWTYYHQMLDSYSVNVLFNSAFQSVSAFANAGFALLDLNTVPWAENAPYLIIAAALVLLGNTLYAPTLRGLLYLMYTWTNERNPRKYVCKYLLDHPRKCYTHLFPASATFWLVITVIAFNVIEFICFCGLDFNSAALQSTPAVYRLVDGIFQSISTRNAGFNVVFISLLSPAMLVLYVGLMYVAVYPVYLTRQTSREEREVYDDDDIGVFLEDMKEGVMDHTSVLSQSKRLVGKDSVLLFLALFVICIIQANQIVSDPSNFGIFNIIFEVISAYGNVGLSLGYTCPATAQDCVSPPYSLSGVFSTGSKVVIVLVMLLGRHRGLPDNIDAAIVIPERRMFRKQAQGMPKSNSEVMSRVLDRAKARSTLRRRIQMQSGNAQHE